MNGSAPIRLGRRPWSLNKPPESESGALHVAEPWWRLKSVGKPNKGKRYPETWAQVLKQSEAQRIVDAVVFKTRMKLVTVAFAVFFSSAAAFNLIQSSAVRSLTPKAPKTLSSDNAVSVIAAGALPAVVTATPAQAALPDIAGLPGGKTIEFILSMANFLASLASVRRRRAYFLPSYHRRHRRSTCHRPRSYPTIPTCFLGSERQVHEGRLLGMTCASIPSFFSRGTPLRLGFYSAV